MKKLSLLKFACYVFSVLVIAILFSCKKSKPKENAPEEIILPKYFEVNFNNQTIDIAKIDSVTIELINTSLSKSIKHKLEKKVTSFNLSIENLQIGNWDATITVYENFDSKSRRKYILKKNISISNLNQFNAPIIKLNNEWKPYIIITNLGREVELIVSELNDNALVEINTYGTKKFDYVYLDRSIFGLSEYDRLDFVYWEDFKDEMPKKIIDDKAMSTYTERVKIKKWNSSSLYFVMSGDVFFDLYYRYDNRYKN